MRRAIPTALLFCFIALHVGVTFAGSSTTIIQQKNVYGGVTKQLVFDPEDERYQAGILKIVEYYDAERKIKKVESYYTEEQAHKDGVARRAQYYRTERFDSTMVESKFYYSPDYAKLQGVKEADISYSESGKKTSALFYFTEEYAKKKKIAKLEVLYNDDGKAIRRMYYDSQDQLLADERLH